MLLIRVNYADIESKSLGGTSKNLHSLFQAATQEQTVLFFDEADAILSQRISAVSHAADHGINSAKSSLITLLDTFSGVVVFATNLFENYDTAFVRRILFNIEFRLPDTELRSRLWKFHLSSRIPRDVTYERITELSDGLSGGDIRNLSIKLALSILSGRVPTIDEECLRRHIEEHDQTIRSHRAKRSRLTPVQMHFEGNDGS